MAETIRLMGEVDAVIEAHGGWPLDGGGMTPACIRLAFPREPRHEG
jgi:hypothetical protein